MSTFPLLPPAGAPFIVANPGLVAVFRNTDDGQFGIRVEAWDRTGKPLVLDPKAGVLTTIAKLTETTEIQFCWFQTNGGRLNAH